MTDKDGKTAMIQQNRYNGDGQRIQKVEGSKITNYYYQDGVVSLYNRWREYPDISELDWNRWKYPCNTEIWK